MVRERVIETLEGIQDAFDVEAYDREMRRMRKRGWIETLEILKAGILSGKALEISPGPGRLGIDWLSRRRPRGWSASTSARTCWCVLAATPKATASENARSTSTATPARCRSRTRRSTASSPTGGLHEWPNPIAVFDEVGRVLKPGSRFCITDLRRDANLLVRALMPMMVRQRPMRAGLVSSFNAAYTEAEARRLISKSHLSGGAVS